MPPANRPAPAVLRYASIAVAVVLLTTTLASRISLVTTLLLNIMGEEQNVVYGVIKWMKDDVPLYSDPQVLPMDIIQYSPLYYYVTGSIGRLVGVDPMEPQEVYVLIRTIGLIFNALFVFMAFNIARTLGAARWSALLWCAVLFNFLPRQVYSRPDSLNLLLFASGTFLFLRWLRSRDGKNWSAQLLPITVIFCAAMCTKQSGMLGLLIVGAYLLFTRDWRALLQHVVVAGVVIGTVVALLCVQSGGTAVWHNLITSIRNAVNLDLVRSMLTIRFLGFFTVQAIGLVLAWRWWRSGDAMRRGLALAFVASVCFGYSSGLKYGSSTAYCMEGLMLGSAMLASLLGTTDGERPTAQRIALFGLALLFIHPGQMAWGITVLRGRNTVKNEAVQYEEAKALAHEFRTDPELSDGLVFLRRHDHLENFLVGRSVLTQRDIFLLETSQRHMDLSAFPEGLDAGTIRFVVSRDTITDLPLVSISHFELRSLGTRHGYFVLENSAWHP